MKQNKLLWICIFVVFVSLFFTAWLMAQNDPNSISDPNEIKLPEGVKMPVQLKCSVHGIIGKAFIAIETDSGTRIYCAQCAKTFISNVFDLNLPKLEVMK